MEPPTPPFLRAWAKAEEAGSLCLSKETVLESLEREYEMV